MDKKERESLTQAIIELVQKAMSVRTFWQGDAAGAHLQKSRQLESQAMDLLGKMAIQAGQDKSVWKKAWLIFFQESEIQDIDLDEEIGEGQALKLDLD